MDIDKVLQKLEIPKEGVFYKCPYCDYKNADKKAVLKHIKSKHQEELKKEGEKMNKKKQQQKRKTQQRRRQQQQKQNREMIEYKDYMYLFAHKKTCLIILEDGTTIKGHVKAKDRYTIMVLDSDYIPKGFDKPPRRIILHKGHIVSVIPLEEESKKEKEENKNENN